jgi:hypothetical protein
MTVVFTGPSLTRAEAAARLPGARVEPPIARGDIFRLAAEGCSTFLIIDGLFAHRLAVAPGELVDALAAGARVIGAASLGAIRASECRPAGMVGCGAVYRWYCLGVLRDDDEVAVATDPDQGHAAVSVALIDVRYALLTALRARLLDLGRAGALLAAARGTHFAQRNWREIFAAAGVPMNAGLQTLCAATDVKGRDARAAVAWMAAHPGARDRPITIRPRPPRVPQPSPAREELERALIREYVAGRAARAGRPANT